MPLAMTLHTFVDEESHAEKVWVKNQICKTSDSSSCCQKDQTHYCYLPSCSVQPPGPIANSSNAHQAAASPDQTNNVYNPGNRNAMHCSAASSHQTQLPIPQAAASRYKTKPMFIILVTAMPCTGQARSGMKAWVTSLIKIYGVCKNLSQAEARSSTTALLFITEWLLGQITDQLCTGQSRSGIKD